MMEGCGPVSAGPRWEVRVGCSQHSDEPLVYINVINFLMRWWTITFLIHCGPVMQICVFTLQLCKTD